MKSRLVGKRAFITNKDHWAYNEWGIIKGFDGEYYHIAIANGAEELIFSRDEFRVRR